MQPNRFARKPIASVDGVVRTSVQSRPIIAQAPVQAGGGTLILNRPIIGGRVEKPSPQPAQKPLPTRPTSEAFAPPPTRKSWRQRFELPLILITGMIGGFLVQSLWFGVPVVIAYGLYALFFHIPSRTTFALAAVALVAVSALLLFKPNMQLASNFTTYTFLLLVIGVIALIIEGRPLRRKRRQKNRR